MEFADKGAPIVLQAPDSPVAQAYDQCAKELANLVKPRPKARKRISLPLGGQ
jgi:MinD-like ATPase involved in chromosome partitioning or flagellar assembly